MNGQRAPLSSRRLAPSFRLDARLRHMRSTRDARHEGSGSTTDASPPPFVDHAPADRFCDLVLTGGVTSGVIYPSAAVELARHYRFRSIGGTSAGAMAAALTAAAEYRRRSGGGGIGFQMLAQVPHELAKDVT